MSLDNSYQNRNDSNNSVERGLIGEQRFLQQLESMGIPESDIKESDPMTDKKDHIDLFVKLGGSWRGIDVKGQKNKSRHSSGDEDQSLWVELQNVYGGDGWIVGKADLVAFERSDRWIVVPRVKLLGLVNKLVDPETKENYVRSACFAEGNWYKRNKWNRKDGKPNDDLVTLLKFSDLVTHKVPHKVWRKKKS